MASHGKIQGSDIKYDPSGLSSSEASARIAKYGLNQIAKKKQRPVFRFLKRFVGPIPFMLLAIIVISFLLGREIDGYIVIGLLVFNSIVGFIEEYKADNTLELLEKKLEVMVNVKRDGEWRKIQAKMLVPGDLIRLRLGSIVPADAIIIEADSLSVDQSMLTGESLPVDKKKGETLFSSSVVRSGEATAFVTETGSRTSFGKTAELVKVAKSRTHLEHDILEIIKYLIVVDVVLIAVVLFYSYFSGINIFSVVPFSLLVLLASVPVALPAAFTVSMAYGTERLSSKGILVTRLDAIEEASTMNVICLDKTGTITKNKLSVVDVFPSRNFSKEDVALYGSAASRLEDEDQIDIAVLEYFKRYRPGKSPFSIIDFTPFDPATKLSKAAIKIGGNVIYSMKGFPEKIIQECELTKKDISTLHKKIDDFSKKGYRTIAVAFKKKKEERWRFVGLIALNDRPRDDSSRLIKELKNLGLKVKMLTGDNATIAKEIAKEIGMGDNILDVQSIHGKDRKQIAKMIMESDGLAGIYPKDKYMIVKALQDSGFHVGMTGDGVNDAPALKQAEVGIAVSSATDVAKSAASIILTSAGVEPIVKAITESRSIFERMITYTINKISRIFQIAFFLSVAFLILRFLPIRPLQLILMIFLYDIGSIALATDHESYSSRPDTWYIKAIMSASLLFGSFTVAETSILSVIAVLYLHLSQVQFQTFLFIVFAVSTELTLMSIRARKSMFASAPSRALSMQLVLSIAIAVAIALLGVLMVRISVLDISIVFLFVFLMTLLLDKVKQAAYSRLAEFRFL